MLDLSGVTPDLTDFIAIAAFLISALVTYVGVRVVICLLKNTGEDCSAFRYMSLSQRMKSLNGDTGFKDRLYQCLNKRP